MARTPSESRAEAARLYHSANLTEAEVARILEVGERTVRRWLADTARPPGPRGRADVAGQLIADLHDKEGLSFGEIARRVHMSKTGVRMRYYAVTGRPRPGRERGDEDDRDR